MNHSSSIVIFCISIILLYILWFTLREKKSYNLAPKKIWSYWDDPTKIPKTINICIDSWKKYNPDYEIVLLNKNTYKGYVTIPTDLIEHPNFNDSSARFSDLLRLWVLAEHGGVWIDSSVLLSAPLNDWLFPKYAEFSGFYLDGFTTNTKYPVIESWFFACNKGSKFIQLWRDEFSKMAEFPNVEKYIDNRKKAGVDVQKINNPIYLAIHVAAQKVLQLNNYPADILILRKAEDGPFKYLVEANWDSDKALQLACSNKKYQTPIMKMRGSERNALEKRIDYDLTNEVCKWII